MNQSKETTGQNHALARRLGLFDATMIVMGGSSARVSLPILTWLRSNSYASSDSGSVGCRGLIALAGAFIYAELSSQSSESGGQYVYLRDALHPLVAFGYGWSLRL